MSNHQETDETPQAANTLLALIAESTSRLTHTPTIIDGSIEIVASRGQPQSTDWHDPTLTAVVLKLLASAHQVIANNGEQADRFIAQAAALLSGDGDISRSQASAVVEGSAHARLAPWQTKRVVDFIEANLTERIRLNDLARVARLSVSHFSKAFRSDFSQSPYAYIVRRRIARAQEMLIHTEEPLAFVANACGLSDQSHLTRLFHRIVGVSPSRWRRLRRSAIQ